MGELKEQTLLQKNLKTIPVYNISKLPHAYTITQLFEEGFSPHNKEIGQYQVKRNEEPNNTLQQK